MNEGSRQNFWPEQCSFAVVEGDPHKGKRQDGQGTLEEPICLVAMVIFWFGATASAGVSNVLCSNNIPDAPCNVWYIYLHLPQKLSKCR